MKLTPYAKYKRTGVAWAPCLPTEWVIKSLRWLSKRYTGGTPDKGNEAYWFEGHIPWLNSGAVNAFYITEPSAYISTEGLTNSSAKWIPKGALVMALAGQGKTKGMAAQLGLHATCNQSMAAIVPDRHINPRYLLWWLAANYKNIRNLAGGEARDGLNLELLGAIPCPVPDENEQQAIADFLDRETETIDKLIARKRTLIVRLKEKRTALISRTVTRGLPPDAARDASLDPHPTLKPSGMDCLGEVPVHWDVAQLRRRCTILDCMHRTVPFVEDGVPLASIREVHGFEVDLSDAKQTTEEEYLGLLEGGRRPQIGDILFSRNATVGDAAIVATSELFAMGQDVCLIRCDAQHPKYVQYLLRSGPIAQQVDSFIVGATIRRINVGQIRTFWGCWPPVDEQLAVTNYLDRETAVLDAMVDKIETVIENLQEYRAALIMAAVTGKVDVRKANVEIVGGQCWWH